MLNIKDKFMDNKNKLKTPEILKDAFWKLYSEKEISKIRISEITNLAGYNRGVFYLYFKNIGSQLQKHSIQYNILYFPYGSLLFLLHL